jgi:hypothetical protein
MFHLYHTRSENLFSGKFVPAASALLQSTSRKNIRLVPIPPMSSFQNSIRPPNNDGHNSHSFNQSAEIPKVDMLYYSHALKRRGLFENVEMKMERAVAIKTLSKILGKSLGWRVDPKAPSEEDRIEARAKLKIVGAERDALNKQKQTRMQEILDADAEYQRLKLAAAEAKTRSDDLLAIICRYRFTVGTSNRMFFLVKAQGDSWEEVIAKLKQAA